ncbi:unknown [Eubacterium sp. CAG:786]|nr:unknown [Eubacterium sp. CAG:786]
MHADIRGDCLVVADVLQFIRALLEFLVVNAAVGHNEIPLKAVCGAAAVLGIFLDESVEISARVQLRDYLLSLGEKLLRSRFTYCKRALLVVVGAAVLYLGDVRVVEFEQNVLYPAGILRQPVIAVVGIALVVGRVLVVHLLDALGYLVVFLLGVLGCDGVVPGKLFLQPGLYLLAARGEQYVVAGHAYLGQLVVEVLLGRLLHFVVAGFCGALACGDVAFAAVDVAVDKGIVAFLNGCLVLFAEGDAHLFRLVEHYLLVDEVVYDVAALLGALVSHL